MDDNNAAWEPGTLLPSLRAGTAVARRRAAGPIVVRQSTPTSAASFKYEHPEDGDDDPDEDRYVGADLALAKRISEFVERKYPGHPWEIDVQTQYGVVQIRLPALMGGLNCFVAHVKDLQCDPKLRQIDRACGEILERYRLPRNNYNRDDFAAAVSKTPFIFKKDAPVPE